MMGLNAWETMLWIVCLAALLVPIIAVLVNSIFIGFYKAKLRYYNQFIGALANAFEKASKAMTEKKDG